MSINGNKAAFAAAMKDVRGHPMCAYFADNGRQFIITHPPGFAYDGLRVDYRKGKTAALRSMLLIMEELWLLPVAYPPLPYREMRNSDYIERSSNARMFGPDAV